MSHSTRSDRVINAFEYRKDDDGIVEITMNMSGTANTMDEEYRHSMEQTIARLESDTPLLGVVIASAKKTFVAGGDLNALLAVQSGQEAEFFARLEADKRCLRRLERLKAPVVAAINGAALGGGFELCLACNHRVVLDHPATLVGLPEVTLGLLPGGGGIVRLVHLLGLEKALPLLLEGFRMKARQALEAGIVDAVVAGRDELVPYAKAWIKANSAASTQPWDRKEHAIPGGTAREPHLIQALQKASLALLKKTRGLLPAPRRILTVAAEATMVDFDTALREESRALAYLVTRPESKNIISTMFFQMNQVIRGASRPKDLPRTEVKKLGVLGAGMMGHGIAYCAAFADIPVALYDVTPATAQKGKINCERLLSEAVSKGRIDGVRKEQILQLINPTEDLAELSDCDLVIEAVFENLDVKRQIIRSTDSILADRGFFATNTSTIPISLLAEASEHPAHFIGMHFFSPVQNMQLVEIICGRATSEATLGKAFDFVRQIGKTPIVVNDSLGFFTSRVFSSYLDEGTRLLKEGVHPVAIENLARQIGMPVGPLAVQDEVSQQLTHTVAETHRSLGIFGSKGDATVATEVAEMLMSRFGRGGRYHGGGFYEYPSGAPKHIWPKLYELFYRPGVSIEIQDIKDRLLFRPVIESINCLQEGVLRSAADGNIGSILGIGAPLWTGGYLQFVNSFGLFEFIARTQSLAARFGHRFAPPRLILERSQRNEQIV
jgi:3-hydroxyacyl-CoA dehydrogenase / enoyl-CoA hydratase / 3-hydroxybutyryl-CoA epimerase